LDAVATLIEEAKSIAPSGDRLFEAYIDLARLNLGQWIGTEGSWVREVIERIDDLIDVFRGEDDNGALVTALMLKGEAYWDTNVSLQAESAWEDALARAAGNPRLQGPLINRLLQACVWGPLPIGKALLRCDELRARAPTQREVEAGALIAKSVLTAASGRFDEARKSTRELDQIEAELGLRLEAAAGRGQNLATVEMLAGKVTEAERLQRESCEALEAMGERSYLSTVEALLAHTLCSQERWEEAVEMSRRAEEHGDPDDVSTHHLWRNARAKAYARLRKNKEAIRLSREAWALQEPGDMLDQKIRALMDLAEVLTLSGERGEGIARLHQALRLARQKEHSVYEDRILELLPPEAVPS
jgi:tetratricopeptide (TPR) repeat protein